MTQTERPVPLPIMEERTEGLAQARKAPMSLRVLLGVKRRMTQVFVEDGRLCSATEIQAGPCTVLRVRTPAQDGYSAVQIGFTPVAEDALSKPVAGQFKALGVSPMKYIREVRVADAGALATGQVVDLEGRFKPSDYVDVQGTSKGKGFAGAMKRHGFHGMPASHGSSDKERSPGSLASRRSLGRVLRGQRMAGHLGHETVTVQKIEVVRIDPSDHKLYVYGAVPGPVGSLVVISETVKRRKHRIIRKQQAVLRDKMGNVIKGKGAKARALAETKAKSSGGTEKK